MQFLSWVAVFFLSLSILVTNAVSLYLHALTDYSAGPRTESIETSLSFGSNRENIPLAKQRAYADGAANGSNATPEDSSFALSLITPWPMLQLGPDKAPIPPRPAADPTPLPRHALNTRAPPAIS